VSFAEKLPGPEYDLMPIPYFRGYLAGEQGSHHGHASEQGAVMPGTNLGVSYLPDAVTR
jgi:hypothetical protein